MRGARQSGSLLADALDVVVGSENSDRRVNMVEIDDQLAKHGTMRRDKKMRGCLPDPDRRACTGSPPLLNESYQGIRSFGRRAVARVSPFMRSPARC